jgi:hypothetical protein
VQHSLLTVANYIPDIGTALGGYCTMKVNLCIVFVKLLLLLLLLFVFYCQDSSCNVSIVILMTSYLSTLVDLWNTE